MGPILSACPILPSSGLWAGQSDAWVFVGLDMIWEVTEMDWVRTADQAGHQKLGPGLLGELDTC